MFPFIKIQKRSIVGILGFVVVLVLSVAPSFAAEPWQASNAFEDVFEYIAVDDMGQTHTFKVRYSGLLNHYKYQTGNARFPDNRVCHYGFSRQIRRSFIPSSNAEFDPRLVGKVTQEQIYTPNLWGSAAVDLNDFIGWAIRQWETIHSLIQFDYAPCA